MKKFLIVLLGPTGVGKTDLSIGLAKRFQTPIISADSRQIYRGMSIGTAAPSDEQLSAVPHLFIGTHDVTDYYSASMYEQEVLSALNHIYDQKDTALLVGGSMMYISAVINGIDEMPDVQPDIRERVWRDFYDKGLDDLRQKLKEVDPSYLERIDPNNHKRIIHALEVYYSTGAPFSSFHRGIPKERPFDVIMIGLDRERTELYERINNRVYEMFQRGLVSEAQSLLPFRSYNALNTVGYKETFRLLDGAVTEDEAIRQIAKNTRVYARKQLSWFRRDHSIRWFAPEDTEAILAYIEERKRGRSIGASVVRQ